MNEDGRFIPEGSRLLADAKLRRSRAQARMRHDAAIVEAEIRRMSTARSSRRDGVGAWREQPGMRPEPAIGLPAA
jgi:hypothetical protein